MVCARAAFGRIRAPSTPHHSRLDSSFQVRVLSAVTRYRREARKAGRIRVRKRKVRKRSRKWVLPVRALQSFPAQSFTILGFYEPVVGSTVHKDIITSYNPSLVWLRIRRQGCAGPSFWSPACTTQSISLGCCCHCLNFSGVAYGVKDFLSSVLAPMTTTSK